MRSRLIIIIALVFVIQAALGNLAGLEDDLQAWKEKMLRQHMLQADYQRTVSLKTGRDRTNYASSDCSAKVMASSPEASHSSGILSEDKDRYMLTPCKARKWVVIALCEEILLDTVSIANFEYYSSTFKDFQVLGSQQYVFLSFFSFCPCGCTFESF